jgi:hypothetical protein
MHLRHFRGKKMTAMEEIDYDGIREAEAIISGEIDSTPKTRELAEKWLRMYGQNSGMDKSTGEDQTRVRGNGNHPMRTMQQRNVPVICSSLQTPVHNNGAGVEGGSFIVPTLSRTDRV